MHHRSCRASCSAVNTATADGLRTQPERVPEAVAALRDKVKQAAKRGDSNGSVDVAALAAAATDVGGARVLTLAVAIEDPKELLVVADKVKGQLGEQAVVVLGAVGAGKVNLVAAVTPALVARGVHAGSIIKIAAGVAGGGGGGRDTVAQAGGKDPAKLPDALQAAHDAIAAALA